MGPLFSILLLLSAMTAAALIIFVAAKVFLPFRASVVMAVLTTIAGTVGSAIGLLVQAPFYPETIQSRTAVLTLLGIAFGSGCVAAGLTARAVWQRMRSHER